METGNDRLSKQIEKLVSIINHKKYQDKYQKWQILETTSTSVYKYKKTFYNYFDFFFLFIDEGGRRGINNSTYIEGWRRSKNKLKRTNDKKSRKLERIFFYNIFM